MKELYEGGAYEIVHAMLPVWRCDVYQPHSGLAAELVARGHRKHPGAVVQKFSWVANHLNLKRVGLARIEAEMMAAKGGAGGEAGWGGVAPCMLCSSSQMQEFAGRQFPALPETHLVSAMNGIDLNYFDPAYGVASRKAIREEWGIEKEQRLGVLVGNNWKLKGVQEAIEALALAKDPRLVVMIVGREEAAGYKKQAQRLGVAERVKFVGRVGDLRTLYGAADFMLLPTRRDTCSLVVLEGLAMGLPVITTLQNGASDVIEEGRQGILLERGDPEKLAAALRVMLEGERLKAMAQEAMAMRVTLSLEHHVEKIVGVYRRVIETRRGVGASA